MIIGCVITYNDEAMLPGCLESLRGQVDRLIVVDGAFATYPLVDGNPASTDATREVAWCYGVEWISCHTGDDGRPRAWETEMEKRSSYLVGEEGDWYLHLDTDERLIGELPELEDGAHYALAIHVAGRVVWVPRLFQHRGWMRYEGAHNALWSDDELIHLRGAVRVNPARCRLAHLAAFRPAWQQLAKQEHYAKRTPAEKAYREIHGI